MLGITPVIGFAGKPIDSADGRGNREEGDLSFSSAEPANAGEVGEGRLGDC